MHIGQPAQEPLRQIVQGDEQDTPDPAECIDIIHRAVAHRGAPKELGHARQFVRSQTGQRDARKGE